MIYVYMKRRLALIYKRYYSTSNTDDVKEEADITAANAKNLVQISLFSQEPAMYHSDDDFINSYRD